MSLKERMMKTFGSYLAELEKHKEQISKRIGQLITDQVLNESGKFLFAGNMEGIVFVQNIVDFDEDTGQPAPCQEYNLQARVFSLAWHAEHLLVGTMGQIVAYKWNECKLNLSTIRAWRIKIPAQPTYQGPVGAPEVNCMLISPDNNTHMLIGCGDTNCYEIDLVSKCILRSYVGHQGLIHDLKVHENGCILSASEDGTVRIWKQNTRRVLHTITPWHDKILKREESGKFIGALDVIKNFFVCGGGTKPAVYHLSTMSLLTDLDFPELVHSINIIDDKIFITGESSYVRNYELAGTKLAQIKLKTNCIYTACYNQETANDFMSLAGGGNQLHIVKNLNILDYTIDLYSPYVINNK